MAPQKERYHPEQVSTGGKSEFETYKNEKDNLHYFHFNDENGQALLFSQGYKDARSRNGGIRSVEKNANRVEHHRDGDCHYFVIRAANRQEIARSRDFETAEEMEAAIKAMQQSLLAGVAIGLAPTLASKQQPAAIRKEAAHQPSRYRFNLEWQSRGRHEPLLGVIEYPVTGDKATLKGIDTAAIERFVSRFATPPVVPNPIKTMPPVVPAETKELTLMTPEGQLAEELLFQGESGLEARMNLAETGKKGMASDATFMAKVYAKSLESNDRVLIAERQGYVANTGEIAMPLQLDKLKPGTYRLQSDVDLHADGCIRHVAGSRLLHLVE
mgnify:CR=1 FL=1